MGSERSLVRRTSSLALAIRCIVAIVGTLSVVGSVAAATQIETKTLTVNELYELIEKNLGGQASKECVEGVILIESRAEYPEGESRFLVLTDAAGYIGLHRKYVFVLVPNGTGVRFAPGQHVRIVGRVVRLTPEERGAQSKLYDHLFSLKRQSGSANAGALRYFEAEEISTAR